ncbi:MAG: hypothetical protein JEZ08_17560 [Clostridiales bacterium]|nr:hypothetical protein [Clostridiales bacterium]
MRKKILIISIIFIVAIVIVNALFHNVLYTTFKNTVVPLDSFTGYPLASDYGLRSDDEGSARFNGDLLKAAFTKFGGIIVDGSYHVKMPSGTVNDSIGIIGDADFESELIFNPSYSTVMFDSAKLKELYISDVSFINNSEDDLVIAYPKSELDIKIDSIVIKNSNFEGNISAYRIAGNGNVDPNTSDVVVDQFVFDNNTVRNTYTTFLLIKDIPYNNIEITNNNITNFKYIFASLFLTNENEYNPELFSLRKNLLIQNNYVTSEDDWWGADSGSLYHTFVLAEGDKVEYSGNTVENLKSKIDVALYDTYLSCNEVLYENNIWKNNIVFDADKQHNAFLKSKNGSEPLIRYYRNNTFIVEKDFATKFGYDEDTLFVYFISLENRAEYYEITNNSFEGYHIKFPASTRFIENLVFENNTITADKMSGSVVHLQTNDEFETGTIEFSHNTIDVKEHWVDDNSSSELPLFKFYNHTTEGNDSRLSLIDFTDNKISAPLNYVFVNAYDENFGIDYTLVNENMLLNPDEVPITEIFEIENSDKVYQDSFQNIFVIPSGVRFRIPTLNIFDDLNLRRIRIDR